MSQERLAVPQTVDEMREIMDTPKRAAEWITRGQWSELMDAYNLATAKGSDGKAIKEQLHDQVISTLREMGVSRPNLAVGDFSPGSVIPGTVRNQAAPGAAMESVGFKTLGEVAAALYPRRTVPDSRLQEAYRITNAAFSSIDPSAGGLLIPEPLRAEILTLSLPQAIVRPRATVIPMTSLSSLIPAVDETTRATGTVFGGLSFSRVQEGEPIPNTEAKFMRIRLQATKQAATADVPNELMADAPALTSWLYSALPAGMAFAEDHDYLLGAGGGEPLGVHNAPARIVVTAEDGQPSSTINVKNVLKMFARMLPSGHGDAIWLANSTCFPELMTLTINVGTGGAPVALLDISADPPMKLLGRPLILTEHAPALGAEGDLAYVSLRHYLVGDRQAMNIEASEHEKFSQDLTVLRIIARNDGRPWVQSPLQPVNGDTVSPFVVLGARVS